MRQDGSRYTRADSVDHFICPEPDFERICGPNPKAIRIHFPYERIGQSFPSGLEKWAVSKNGRPLLLCYTKGDGVAHGLGGRIENKMTVLDPKKDRQDFPCGAHDCRYYGKERSQGCRPQARLNFQLVGGARDSVYRFETKGLGSIEGITAVLQQYPDLRGLEFELRVEMKETGAKKYPVVTISEVGSPSEAPEVQSEADVPAAPSADGEPEGRAELLAYLDGRGLLQNVGPTQVAWIRQQGYVEALRILKERDGA